MYGARILHPVAEPPVYQRETAPMQSTSQATFVASPGPTERPATARRGYAHAPSRNPITEGDAPVSPRASKRMVPGYYEFATADAPAVRQKKARPDLDDSRAGMTTTALNVERPAKRTIVPAESATYERPTRRPASAQQLASRNPIVQSGPAQETQPIPRLGRTAERKPWLESEEDMSHLYHSGIRRAQEIGGDYTESASSVAEPVYLGGRADRVQADKQIVPPGLRPFDHKTHSHRDVFQYRHGGGLAASSDEAFVNKRLEREQYEQALRQAATERAKNAEEYNRLRARSDRGNPALQNFLYDKRP